MTSCGLHCLKIVDIGVNDQNGSPILKQVGLHAHCGQLTAIIGRNGAGKSTLLKAILGQIPHTGTVNFSGHDGQAALRRPVIGYVPQSLNIDPASPATVEDVACSFISSRPVFLPPSRKTIELLRHHFARFDAQDLLPKQAGKLSGGECQRVLLAIATMPLPDLLILDEPVSGVDHEGLQRFYHTVEQLKEKEDMVILLVSHDLQYVRHHADRVILLDKTVLADGTPEDVYATEAFRQAFGNERGDHHAF